MKGVLTVEGDGVVCVVLEVEAHAGELDLDLHTRGLEDVRRPDAAPLQDLRRVHRPS